jgi:hypothetical protein
MSGERMVHASESAKPGRYEIEKKAEIFMNTILREGETLHRRSFEDASQRDDAARLFKERYTSLLTEVPGADKHEYEVSGDQLNTRKVETVFSIDEGEPRQSFQLGRTGDDWTALPSFESYDAQFLGLMMLNNIRESEEGGIRYAVTPCVLFSKTQLYQLANEHDTLPFEIITKLPILVPTDGTSEIRVKALEKLRIRADAIAKVALTRPDQRLTRSLNKLAGALTVETNEFITLRNLRILRDIAKYGAEDSLQPDNVATAIQTVIGKGRNIRLVGDIYSHKTTESRHGVSVGPVLEVLPNNPLADTNEPTIVIESAQQDLHYVPLSRIQQFEF